MEFENNNNPVTLSSAEGSHAAGWFSQDDKVTSGSEPNP